MERAVEMCDEESEEVIEEDEETKRNLTREALLCIITAFALLEGQDASKAKASLSLDLSFFITHLYRTLHQLALNPDIELSAKSLHLADPNAWCRLLCGGVGRRGRLVLVLRYCSNSSTAGR